MCICEKEKLAICFYPWMLYNQNDNYDTLICEIVERGFNCIRIDDGAGLLWDKDGKIREDVLIMAPFGKYTPFTTYSTIVYKERLNLFERLIRICATSKKYNVKVILSSWFFLHTNWFCEENDISYLFSYTTEEKISFFAKELNKILDALRKADLLDTIAFAEIFNEFDGLPFAGEYRGVDAQEAIRLRELHEKEIEKLKEKHPDILFAFDTYTAKVQEELIPRNIDVLNFHHYYAWPIYNVFQKDIVKASLEEPEIPEETGYYLKEDRISVADVMKEMNLIRTGLDWPRRISLYASIDPDKESALTKLLEKELQEKFTYYIQKLYEGIECIIATHDKVVPHSRIVMGEGVTYCASPTLAFERDSKLFWEMIREQMKLLHKKDLWGSVITTTHAPERNVAWPACKERYIEANSLFLGKEN